MAMARVAGFGEQFKSFVKGFPFRIQRFVRVQSRGEPNGDLARRTRD